MLKRSLLLVGVITIVLLGWTNNAFAQSPGTCTCDGPFDDVSGACVVTPSGDRCNEGYSPQCNPARNACGRCNCISDEELAESCGLPNRPPCPDGTCKDGVPDSGNLCVNAANSPVPFHLCNGVPEGDLKNNCVECLEQNEGVWTAVGCIHFDPRTFVTDFLKIAMGIAGGIALLLMVYGAFQISVSAGDPKKAEEGREMITGTIAGLLFIIFSIVLLRVIGIDILQIPGLR